LFIIYFNYLAVSIDTYGGSGGPVGTSSAWITIAAGNVLPEELLKTTSVLLSAQHIDIFRAHLDVVKVPENSTVDIPAHVTMLRLLISPDPVSTGLDWATFVFHIYIS